MSSILYTFKLAGEAFAVSVSILSVIVMCTGSNESAKHINSVLLRQIIILLVLSVFSSIIYIVMA